MSWRLCCAALLAVAAEPHRKSQAHRHRTEITHPVPAAEVQLVDVHSADPPSEPCSPDVELLQHVFGPRRKNRKNYFKEGSPYNMEGGDEKVLGLSIFNLPRGCQKWKEQPHCCTRGFFSSISESTRSLAEGFAFVRDHYHNFRQDLVEPALNAADGASTQRLKEAAEAAKPGTQAILDFIDQCQDPLRLFFASIACSLCAPNLESNLTESQTLHVNRESCSDLQSKCEMMPERLEGAGRDFLHARDLLKSEEPQEPQELWYNRTKTWLERAGRLALLTSEHVKFYKTNEFCKNIETSGYVYKPDVWGDVQQLHISVLATDEEKQSFVPQNELHYIIPQDGQEQRLKEEAARVEAEFKGEALIELDSDSDHSDTVKSLQCVNGKHMGSHCSCKPCWSGIECDKPMAVGPYRQQDFEPLVLETLEGAQQTLALQGCDLHSDLRHQMARITLIPQQQRLDYTDMSKKDSLCISPGNEHSASLKMRIPETASPKEYVYLIDVPLGDATWYEVCYCYGVECSEGQEGWYSVGEVQVVRSHEDRDAIVMQMFTPEAVLNRRLREKQVQKTCVYNWVVPKGATFVVEHHPSRASFKCKEGFANLKGVSELICDQGFWKVAAHSEGPVDLKLVPKEMDHWDTDYPICQSILANCSKDDILDVVAKESPPVVNVFSGDGLLHYRCPQEDNQPMRLLVRNFEDVLKPGEEVLVNRTQVAEVVNYDKATRKYQVKLLKGATAEVEKAHLEWMMRETSFTRKCDESGQYVPAKVELRCLLVMPENPDEASKDPPKESGKARKKVGSSLLERSATEDRESSEHEETVSGELVLRPWPLKLSMDTDRVFHVDSCWMSPLNCSDNKPAEDTARYLQKEPVFVETPEPQSRLLGGGIALGLLLVLGWSLRREK